MNDPINLFGLSTTWFELISFVLSVTCVALNIRQIHWAWLFAILSSAMYGMVFYSSKLYGDTGLQIVFIIVAVWGWTQWLRRSNTDGAELALSVTQLGVRERLWAIAAWLIGFIILAQLLRSFTDTDVPYQDGFLTAGSLLGTVLLSRKKIENWLVWIVVDVLYVALYVYKGLMLTAALYALFVVMAYVGYRSWKRSEVSA
jgi:nicotinamide mononucleotide transporter